MVLVVVMLGWRFVVAVVVRRLEGGWRRLTQVALVWLGGGQSWVRRVVLELVEVVVVVFLLCWWQLLLVVWWWLLWYWHSLV